mmetsp:Transcript_98670/g.235051  ORF Transcript_98670/g.235051 Transcript_98670/m.235051 type:complete len:248 (+) Transcript_98670:99-842(+)
MDSNQPASGVTFALEERLILFFSAKTEAGQVHQKVVPLLPGRWKDRGQELEDHRGRRELPEPSQRVGQDVVLEAPGDNFLVCDWNHQPQGGARIDAGIRVPSRILRLSDGICHHAHICEEEGVVTRSTLPAAHGVDPHGAGGHGVEHHVPLPRQTRAGDPRLHQVLLLTGEVIDRVVGQGRAKEEALAVEPLVLRQLGVEGLLNTHEKDEVRHDGLHGHFACDREALAVEILALVDGRSGGVEGHVA